MSVFQMIIVFDALLGAFGSGSGVAGLFLFPAFAWRETAQAGIGFHGDGERPGEFGGRAGASQRQFPLLISAQRNLTYRRFKSAPFGFIFSPAEQMGAPSGPVSMAPDCGGGFLALRGLRSMKGTTRRDWQRA